MSDIIFYAILVILTIVAIAVLMPDLIKDFTGIDVPVVTAPVVTAPVVTAPVITAPFVKDKLDNGEYYTIGNKVGCFIPFGVDPKINHIIGTWGCNQPGQRVSGQLWWKFEKIVKNTSYRIKNKWTNKYLTVVNSKLSDDVSADNVWELASFVPSTGAIRMIHKQSTYDFNFNIGK